MYLSVCLFKPGIKQTHSWKIQHCILEAGKMGMLICQPVNWDAGVSYCVFVFTREKIIMQFETSGSHSAGCQIRYGGRNLVFQTNNNLTSSLTPNRNRSVSLNPPKR